MAYDYDVIILGGGIGGAALGKTLAEKGVRVLVLERELAFRDRVRGELIHPWGVAEARLLGLYALLKQTCGYEVRFRINQIFGSPPATPRDLMATSPHQAGSLHFYHPEMQEVLLGAATRAGADVRRGVAAIEVLPGTVPSVRIQADKSKHSYQARLVVGADGRTSACRKWGRFTVKHAPDRMVMTGVLFNELSAPNTAYHIFTNPACGEVAYQIPLGGTRFRCYTAFYQQTDRHRFGSRVTASDFVEASVAAGAPRAWFAGAEIAGPLASFNCAETWIDHPYRAGVTLIGDAAAASDPTFGCGLSLTLRDVRVLSNLLLTETDWEAATHAYAAAHDQYFGSLQRLLNWLMQLLFEPGPVAAARRARAFARLAEDPKRIPDITGVGPEFPSDDVAYRNLFGAD